MDDRGGPKVTGVFYFYCGREEHVSVLRGRSQWQAKEFEGGGGGRRPVSGARSG